VGKLTVEIPDLAHHQIKVIAANLGISIKEYVLARLMPDVDAAISGKPTLRQLATAWEADRKGLKLDRGDRSFNEVIHEGHQW
jgi:hypothetical protein